MTKDAKRYTLLRKLLKALGLSDERIDDLVATIQSWLSDNDDEGGADKLQFPYHLREDFLSAAELNFYRVLQTAVSDWAVLFTKVNLGDLFYPSTGEYGQNQVYRNKIARKHVDFLLCAPDTLRPLLGVELDDSSHQRPDRQQRDKFVDGVFAAAGLPLVHISVRRSYATAQLRSFLQHQVGMQRESAPVEAVQEKPSVPNCSKCGAPMVQRRAKKGTSAGKPFWGCSQYPRCRGIRQIEPEKQVADSGQKSI